MAEFLVVLVATGLALALFTGLMGLVLRGRVSATGLPRPGSRRRQLKGRPVDVSSDRIAGRRATLWYARFHEHRLADRTTVHISESDDLTRRMEALGSHDVRVGDPLFDERFHIVGKDADVVRGVLAGRRVRTALLTCFHNGVQLVSLTPNRVLEIQAPRGPAFDDEAALNRAAELSQALDEARDAEPIGAPRGLPPRGGTGSASGLPIGVPIVSDE